MARIEEHIDIAAATATVFRFCHDITRRAIKRSLANLKTMVELDPSKSAPDPGGA